MHERVIDRGKGIELLRKECVDGEKSRLFCCGYPHFGEHFRIERGIRL